MKYCTEAAHEKPVSYTKQNSETYIDEKHMMNQKIDQSVTFLPSKMLACEIIIFPLTG